MLISLGLGQEEEEGWVEDEEFTLPCDSLLLFRLLFLRVLAFHSPFASTSRSFPLLSLLCLLDASPSTPTYVRTYSIKSIVLSIHCVACSFVQSLAEREGEGRSESETRRTGDSASLSALS